MIISERSLTRQTRTMRKGAVACSLFLADEKLHPNVDLGGGAGTRPLNCAYPDGNEYLMTTSTLELLLALARKVFIYT